MNRYVCVHGHFYQPPREDPWTGEIEPQPDAAPARDWNERVHDECYRPNGWARIVDEVVTWQGHDPEVLDAMLESLRVLREQGRDLIED